MYKKEKKGVDTDVITMARFISKSKNLVYHSQCAKGVIACHRHRSSEATKSQWVEIDGVELLEEHFQRIMVKKATPDWIPFLPGSSFWVPPPPSHFLHKFSVSPQLLFIQDNGSDSESQSQSQSGNAIATPRRTEVTVQLKVLSPFEHVALPEDEEG